MRIYYLIYILSAPYGAEFHLIISLFIWCNQEQKNLQNIKTVIYFNGEEVGTKMVVRREQVANCITTNVQLPNGMISKHQVVSTPK